ncbi:MAG: hypothetical protein PWR27_582 [Petroclostridium sp.]|jgi:hypothetical protein|uniref:hypothetical protein n=1 Tax=Petroclostridium xylanilyticum TaxID=1792311 RepID=UPI000B9978D2|nr:hypothetical protein [Petroclostridium xylanilyticum]MBZ4645632.1 hypothetical protein [Clostridia bacterium]MDK2809873.1 hypothetical protein [Petroclostridium sp.]
MANGFDGLYERNFECILVDKVFDSCLKKVCFDDIKVQLPDGIDPNFCDIEVRFENGVIVPGSLKVLDSSVLPEGCKRIKATVVTNYIVVATCNGKCFEIPGTLPEIPLDIVMYHPDTRSEFKFNIIVETRGEVLDQIVECECNDGCILTLAIGVFVIPKVIGRVQLKLDQVFPYCVPPRECKDFSDVSACDDFDSAAFPDDFYPAQSQYIYPCGQ